MQIVLWVQLGSTLQVNSIMSTVLVSDKKTTLYYRSVKCDRCSLLHPHRDFILKEFG